MLSRLEWIPPPPPPPAPPASTEKWLASVTLIAGLCLMIVGVVACFF